MHISLPFGIFLGFVTLCISFSFTLLYLLSHGG